MPLKYAIVMAEDIRENAMTVSSSVDYVRGLKGKDSVLIASGNLLGALFQDRGTFEGDLNELKTAGMYYITGNTENKPAGFYGLMLVFRSGAGIVQIAYSVYNGESKKRVLLSNGGNWDTWSNWA
jgi:hypothetical protein